MNELHMLIDAVNSKIIDSFEIICPYNLPDRNIYIKIKRTVSAKLYINSKIISELEIANSRNPDIIVYKINEMLEEFNVARKSQ